MKITLATLPQATARQVFEQGKAHLLGQMKKSASEEDNHYCLYRGPNGLKCGAGDFISDEEYDSGMENKNWTVMVRENLVPNNYSELISSIQMIHDSYEPKEWRAQFNYLQKRLEMKQTEGF